MCSRLTLARVIIVEVESPPAQVRAIEVPVVFPRLELGAAHRFVVAPCFIGVLGAALEVETEVPVELGVACDEAVILLCGGWILGHGSREGCGSEEGD